MQFISEKYLSLLTSSSRKYQEVSCSSSFYFLLCSKLWRTNCETRKWQLHEQVRATLCLHSPPPLQTVYSSFFFSLQMGHLMQRGTIDLASHPLLSTLFRHHIQEMWLFSSGRKKRERTSHEYKCSRSGRKEILQIHWRWRKHPYSHTNGRYGYKISSAHFDYFYT